MNAGNSITSEDEKLANKQLKNQWNNIDWKKVEKLVNRLQVRITKAVKEGKWYLVKRLQYLPVTRSYIMYCRVLPLPFGVILLGCASVATLRCKALRTIWRNSID
ncbi:MAG: reverse transcriptase N-terminal domain-containing protein [Candidatus Methanoperedens sp.]|nr:reverse transcriptase N-terminal domain-containing protein [Candidatus Methanoperedens sp.]